MAKVYAGVGSLVLTGQVNTTAYNTTTKKFGTASLDFTSLSNLNGSYQRQFYRYNRSNSNTTRNRRAGFFVNSEGPQYATDFWFYLNSSDDIGGTSSAPALISLPSDPLGNPATSASIRFRVKSDSQIAIELSTGLGATETLGTINASTFSETDFLSAWWWIAFQRDGSLFNCWMGKSGTATQVITNYNGSNFSYSQLTNDDYRLGGDGVGGSNTGFASPDGYMDEFAIRSGTPFSGTVSCPTTTYTGNEEGMMDLFHFDSSDVNSAGAVNWSSGSFIDGDFNPFLQTYDPTSTAFGFLGIPPGVQLGNVTAGVLNNVAYASGVSASTSLGNLLPDSEVVGVSLQAGQGRVVNSATTVATPIPFAGLRSIDCGNQSTLNLLSMPFQQPDYSYYNDFTVECFLRGDGTTNDGGFVDIAINNGSGNPDDLYLYIDGNNLQLNNYEFPGSGYRKKIEVNIGSRTTTDWYHVALVRKNNKYSIFWNGNRVIHDVDSAGNGTADFINITSDDAYLFKPFGGNNASGQAQVNNVNWGSGGNSVSGGTNKRWGGYMANIRTSYIAQYDPAGSTIDIPTAPFDDDASGQSYYYKNEETFQQLNSSTTLPSSFNDLNFTAALGSVTLELGQLAEANGSLLTTEEGNVDLNVQLDPIVLTGQNLIASLGTSSAGPGILVPSTGQNLTISLGDIKLPVSWGNVTTGTTSTWTPVDTGDKAIGP